MKRLFFVIILIVSLSILVSCGQSGHKFTEWEESKRYTCTEDGEHIRHCTECGLVQTAPIPARHTEVIDEAVEATCSKTGLTEGKRCSVCEKVIVAQTETPRIPHTYGEDSVICTVCGFNREEDCDHLNVEILEKAEVTCTENGLTEGKACLDCGEVLLAQEEIVAPGHSEVIDEAVDPTCTEKGLTEGKHCSVCEDVLTPQVEVEALGHSYDNDEDESCNTCGYVRDLACKHENVSTIPARDAGCTEAGLTEGKVCVDCEEVLLAQEEIPALGHTEVIDEAVESTCNRAGLTEGKHCSVCKEVLVSQTETEKKPHTEVIDEAVKPTCFTTGLTAGKHCSFCDEITVKQEELPTINHTFEKDICSVCYYCTLAPGVYDENNVLVESWEQLIENGFVIEQNYTTEASWSDPGTLRNNSCIRGDSYPYNTYTLVISDEVTEIGSYSMAYCYGLVSIVIPNSVKVINSGAFYCTGLSNVYIQEGGDLTIKEVVFSDIDVVDFILSNSITHIGMYAFSNSTFENITIGNRVTEMGEYLFLGCENLKSITVSEGATIIGDYSFSYCDSLTEIYLPSTIEKIGLSAFARTANLKVINYNGTMEDWENIDKHDLWSAYIEVCTIRCTDGDIVVEDYRLDA